MPPKLEVVDVQPEQSFVYMTHAHPYPLCVWHYHSQIEIHMIHHATGQAVIGDYLGEFEHGHLVMTGPNLPHNWHSIGSGIYSALPQKDYVIQFGLDLIETTIGRLPEACSIRRLLDASKLGIEFGGVHRKEAEQVILAMEDADGFRRLLLLFELLHILSRCEDRKSLASPSFLPGQDPETATRVEAIVRFIRKNFDRPLSQPQVAKHFNMSSETFCRFFKKNIGRGFVRYLNAVRIGEACNLLMEEKLSIADVAFNAGFNNISNFNRRFIEEKGMTPSDFRASSRVRFGNGNDQYTDACLQATRGPAAEQDAHQYLSVNGSDLASSGKPRSRKQREVS
jgi:AraC-like DNA-binding protein